jgi:hypothetical protein
MKRLLLSFPVLMSLFLIGCTTEFYESEIPGPVGPTGPQGAPGESGFVFEFVDINFTAPDYEVILEYPTDFEGLLSDIALVYLLWDVQVIDGIEVDVWRPLPQQVFASFGTLQYNYDFTSQDVRLFLEGTFDLNSLAAIDTDNWVARVVIVPGEFWGAGRTDYPSYEEIESSLGLPLLKNRSEQASSRRKTQ